MSHPLSGWFLAERRDWAGLARAEGVDALHGHETSAADFLDEFPIVWSAMVQIVQWGEKADGGELLTMETAAGELITEVVEPGPVQMDLFESNDWDTGNDYWDFRGWHLLTFADANAHREDKESSAIFFSEEPVILYWAFPGEKSALKLTLLELVESHQLLPVRAEDAGPFLNADDFLFRAVRTALAEMTTKPTDLPLPVEFLSLRAVLFREDASTRERCVGLEIWASMGRSDIGLGDSTQEKLIARRTDGAWSYGYGSRWLDFTLDNGHSDPLYLQHSLECTSIIIDVGRAHEFIRLFDSDHTVYRETVMLFADPPGRKVGADDLPDEVLAIGRSVLEAERQNRGTIDYSGPGNPFRVLQSVLLAGLYARLDTFVLALMNGVARGQRYADFELERSWRDLEKFLSEKMSLAQKEKWSQLQIQINPLPSRVSAELADISSVTFTYLSDPDRCELEIWTKYYPFVMHDHHGDAAAVEWMRHYKEILGQINSEYLDNLGFEKMHSDFFVRPFLEPLIPEMMARLLVRSLRYATELGPGFEVFVSGSGTMGPKGFKFSGHL